MPEYSTPDSPPPGPPSSGSAAGQLPTDAEALAQVLSSVHRSAGDYVQHHPDHAGRGGWWASEPIVSAVQQVPARMRSAPTDRRAAVLSLFSAPSAQAGPSVLLTERAAHLGSHPGQISFPGGRVEADDADESAAAVREAHEEVALDPARLQLLGPLPPAPIPVSGFMVTPVLAVAGDTGELVPEAGEVARILQLPLDELRAPENRRMSALRRDGVVVRSPAFVVDDVLVWGFTALLLDRLISRSGWEIPWDPDHEVDPRTWQDIP
ncbi:NUDIX hydrolase [Nesterenkonia aerolata]|uniref:CoA pyrophosphatase n=1 Tax=Nesterenkonia aerolata TaxID=3074079 RepID=A0ABU2DRV5_9MICC|nr:CoA pyrophosphatase [Nesterenkonia sp. LY-0111]MDR8019247.1 CoA pyrophosphatase [Nesterenkonia sp. LY-0111]